MTAFALLLQAGFVSLLTFLLLEHDVRQWWVVGVMAAVAAVSEKGAARLSGNLDMSTSTLATAFTAVAVGPTEAAIVAAATMIADPLPVVRWAVYTAGRGAAGGLAGLAVEALPNLSGGTLAHTALLATTGVVVVELLDTCLVSATLALRGAPLAEFHRAFAPVVSMALPMSVTIVGPLSYVYTQVSEWAVLLFLPPAIVAHRLFALYQEQRRLAEGLVVANQRLERANLSFARSLVAALDARDRYTAGHSAAVAIYARDTASELGLPPDSVNLAHFAGLLHDIGKVGLPPGILEKPGKLTEEERLEMEKHSEIGERILANVEDYVDVAAIVRSHHERIDGQGYPDGLAGQAIPLLSRILAVADAYNAMTSGRPYRAAMPPSEAIRRLRESRATQFDPDVLDAFLAVLDQADDLYKRGATADFALEAQAHAELRLPAVPAQAA